MWEFFIKNNKFAYLFIFALTAAGIYSMVSIPKESSPEVVIPVGIVTTIYPGAPASDIENLITNEVERGLSSLENVKKVTSVSREGVSSVTVEFEATANIDTSIQDLKDEIDLIAQDLPEGAEEPFVTEVDFVNQPILTIGVAGELTDFEFTALSDRVESEIESISGVARVEVQGARDREVTIIVNQEALLRFGISLNDVINGLRNANIAFPIGQIVNDGIAYNVAFEGDITDTNAIQNIGIASRGGQPVYIRDIAIVEDGLAPATSLSRLSINGQPSQNSITFDVYKQSGGDITAITSDVNKRVEELKSEGGILSGLSTVAIIDSGELILTDLISLSSSGIQTVILVVALLMITLGWREGLLAGLAIPLSFLFGFIGLYFSGNTINFLSLFSLILGIGILVDSAIVMIEGINRKMKDDPTIDKRAASISAIREFSAPLISGTLTTVAMFAGLFIVSGVIGQFIASIPFTLIFLLLASMVVALAIVPLLASGFLRRRSETVLEQKQREYALKLESWYKNKVDTVLSSKDKQYKFLAGLFASFIFALSLPISVFGGLVAAPLSYLVSMKFYRLKDKYKWNDSRRFYTWLPSIAITITLSFVVTGMLLPSINFVKVVFFEQGDVDYVVIEIENPEGTVKEVTDVDVRRVEEFLFDEEEIASYAVAVGSGSQFGSGGSGEKFANILISLDENRSRTSTEIVDDLRSELSGLRDIQVTVNQPSDGPPTGAAIIFKFLGDDLQALTDAANSSASLLRDIPNVVNVEASTNNNSTEFVLELDRNKVTSLGLSPFAVSQVARTAVFGSDATSITTLTDEIDIVVKLNVENSETITSDSSRIISINALENIDIPTANGPVPLSSLVSVNLRESSSVIQHEDGERVVSVTADVSEGGNVREIQQLALQKIKEEVELPSGISLSTGGGETDESNKAFAEMLIALLVGVGLMLAVLVLQFNSYLHTQYVLSILPYSLIGIMVGLAITQNALSFPSIMGFIALSGIVVNNSILLIDMMNQMRKTNPDLSIKEVVLSSSANRLRPILLTTTTTVVGMIPLTYAGDLWAPLAYAVMFGLIFSVIITLVLIPILYLNKPGELLK